MTEARESLSKKFHSHTKEENTYGNRARFMDYKINSSFNRKLPNFQHYWITLNKKIAFKEFKTYPLILELFFKKDLFNPDMIFKKKT